MDLDRDREAQRANVPDVEEASEVANFATIKKEHNIRPTRIRYVKC